jgi:hypothetical protein
MEEERNPYSISSYKPVLVLPFIRPRRRWEDSIKIYLQEIRL